MNQDTKQHVYVRPVREIVAILSSSADDRASRAADGPRRRLLPDEVSATSGTDRRVP
jgi:hypothetical protein